MRFKFNEKFPPGTRVEYIGESGSITVPLEKGEKGTVVNYSYGDDTVGVNWDTAYPGRHSCGGECHPDHGYVVRKEWIIECTEE